MSSKLPSPILSETIQSLTKTKIHELTKLRNGYESRKAFILTDAKHSDVRQRLKILLAGVDELKPPSAPDHESIANIQRWLDQSAYDTSIPEEMLCKFESQLREKLDLQSNQHSMGDLYSRLVLEWMNPVAVDVRQPLDKGADAPSPDTDQLERLDNLRKKFSDMAFTPLVTNGDNIKAYLDTLFVGEGGQDALKSIREDFKGFASDFAPGAMPFVKPKLIQCIKGLLRNTLLNDAKKGLLKEFLNNQVLSYEVHDVLNMRWSDLENWTWGIDSMPVEPRKQMNGKWRVIIDEDVLQAIFLHHIGTTWCSRLKTTLREAVSCFDWWTRWDKLPEDVASLRDFYLRNGGDDVWLIPDGQSNVRNVAQTVRESYFTKFFLSWLPENPSKWRGDYDHKDGNGNGLGDDDYDTDEDGSSDDDEIAAGNGERQSAMSIKHLLHRELAIEGIFRQHIDGEVAFIQTDLKWFGTGLSHSTIFAMLEYFDIDPRMVAFFRTFLEAPLDLGDGNVRTRKRGMPMAHALETFFGELVLFVFDAAVNQKAGMNLYRLHDDLWLCGDPGKCATAWKEMQTVCDIFGLEFNLKKTGSVYITSNPDPELSSIFPKGDVTFDLLILDPKTGTWVINQSLVEAHVRQLKLQLDKCPSIISWVETWNSCVGKFFDRSFGEPAACFGRQHVDNILETHKRIQHMLFDDATVTTHLKKMLESRFGVIDIPNAFLYVPVEVGGLGLRNPFVPFFLVREGSCSKTPKELVYEALKIEQAVYERNRERFHNLEDHDIADRLAKTFPKPGQVEKVITKMDLAGTKPREFLSFEEYTKWRYLDSEDMVMTTLRNKLTRLPTVDEVPLSASVKATLPAGLYPPEDSSEVRWTLQLHSDELFRKFGGVRIVEQRFLPLGVMTMLKKRNAAWQMVL